MPPDPKAPPPAPQGGQGGQGAPQGGQGGGLEDRVGNLETEQKRQGGMLEQILNRLPARGQDPAPASSSSSAPETRPVAELVREGIEALEADRAAKAKAADADRAQKDHGERIKKLEERVPTETAATPAGRFRAAIQRGVFGIDDPHR